MRLNFVSLFHPRSQYSVVLMQNKWMKPLDQIPFPYICKIFWNSVSSRNCVTSGGCHLYLPWALTSSFQACFSPLCFELSALPFSLYLCLTPYVWFVSTLERHTLSVVLSSADSLVLVLTDSVGKKTAGWVLQARYIIRLQRCYHSCILL